MKLPVLDCHAEHMSWAKQRKRETIQPYAAKSLPNSIFAESSFSDIDDNENDSDTEAANDSDTEGSCDTDSISDPDGSCDQWRGGYLLAGGALAYFGAPPPPPAQPRKLRSYV